MIDCILSKDSTVSFLKYAKEVGFDRGAECEFFERARTFDDIRLVIYLKAFFEIVDRIKKGKDVGVSIDQLLAVVKDLEEETIAHCSYLIKYDEEFIHSLIRHDYCEVKEGRDLSLLQVLAEVRRLQVDCELI